MPGGWRRWVTAPPRATPGPDRPVHWSRRRPSRLPFPRGSGRPGRVRGGAEGEGDGWTGRGGGVTNNWGPEGFGSETHVVGVRPIQRFYGNHLKKTLWTRFGTDHPTTLVHPLTSHPPPARRTTRPGGHTRTHTSTRAHTGPLLRNTDRDTHRVPTRTYRPSTPTH